MITQIETHDNAHSSHQQQQQKQQQRHESDQIPYSISLRYNPSVPKAGQPTLITIKITENQTQKRVKVFDLLHEKLMHAIIVSEDLSHFSHIHPVFDNKEGKFTVYHVFPETAKYKIWIDFKPKNGNQTLVTFKLDNMIDTAPKPTRIIRDIQYTKQIDQNHKVKLLIPKEIESNKPVDLTFIILDQNSNPITDLTPLMGAGGHNVIISSNLKEFLHVHPTKEVNSTWKGGPDISFSTVFPYPGLYKTWGQFQHQNVIITADFVLEVV
jgi:hypothetical protein